MMEYIIHLFGTDADHQTHKSSPQWWKNFLRGHEGDSIDSINDRLLEYTGVFHCTYDTGISYGARFLTFRDEQDATAFVLRWS